MDCLFGRGLPLLRFHFYCIPKTRKKHKKKFQKVLDFYFLP